MKRADWREYRQLKADRPIQEGCTMSQTVYVGCRTQRGARVSVVVGKRTVPLPMREDLWNHSPSGFEWGYGGSGPAQLALALLAHHTQDDDKAVELHQAYKWDVVAKLQQDEWAIQDDEIDYWLWDHDQERQDETRAAGQQDSGIDLSKSSLERPE